VFSLQHKPYCGCFKNLNNKHNLDVKNMLLESVRDNCNFLYKIKAVYILIEKQNKVPKPSVCKRLTDVLKIPCYLTQTYTESFTTEKLKSLILQENIPTNEAKNINNINVPVIYLRP